jgi:hypothetical protein
VPCKSRFAVEKSVLWIRIGFNADPGPAFLVNADPGFDDQKLKKITAEKFIYP